MAPHTLPGHGGAVTPTVDDADFVRLAVVGGHSAMATLRDDRLRFAMAIAMPAAKRPPPRRECARRGPSSHPLAKPRGRDPASHRRPDTRHPVQCPPHPRRHHRGRARAVRGHRTPIWLAAWGRYNAGAGRGRAIFAPLTACFTLGYTEKTSIKPVIPRTRRTCCCGAARDRSPPLSRARLSTRTSTPGRGRRPARRRGPRSFPVRHGDPVGAAQEDIGQSAASTRRSRCRSPPDRFMGVFHQSSCMQQPMKRRLPCTSDRGRAVS